MFNVYLGGVFLLIFPTYLNILWLYFLIPVFLVTLPEYLLVKSNVFYYCSIFKKLFVLLTPIVVLGNKIVELAFLFNPLLLLLSLILGSTDADLKLTTELDCFNRYILVDKFSYLNELNSNFGRDIFIN
mgnify:CR=1 FL=1